MKKLFLSFVLLTGLASCSQGTLLTERGTGLAPVKHVELSGTSRVSILDLGPVQAEVHNKYTLTSLRPGYSFAKVKWTAHTGATLGFDNIYPTNSPDRINLGLDDGITIEVLEYR